MEFKGYDNWKLSSAYDNDKDSDLLTVDVTFHMVDTDEIEYDFTARNIEITRGDAETFQNEDWIDLCADEINSEWEYNEGQVITYTTHS